MNYCFDIVLVPIEHGDHRPGLFVLDILCIVNELFHDFNGKGGTGAGRR